MYKQNLDRHTTNLQLLLTKRYENGWDVGKGHFLFTVHTFFSLSFGSAGDSNQGFMKEIILKLDRNLFTTLYLH